MDSFSLEDRIVIALRRISQAIDVWSRFMLQTYGLTSPQLATLREIMAGKNVSTGTLASALHLSQPTVTGILTRLEQRGLIARVRSENDRRSVVATVTDEGRKLAARSPQLLRDSFCQELRELPVEEQEQILAALQRVAQMMHAPEVSDEVPYFASENSQPEPSSSAR